jgi:hypothetical protein
MHAAHNLEQTMRLVIFLSLLFHCSSSSKDETDTGTPTASSDDTGENTDDEPVEGDMFDITEIPDGTLSPFQGTFSKYMNVFGIHILATSAVPDEKLIHAATVMAEYLDNDEDGTVDDALALSALTETHDGAGLVMFGTNSEAESIFDEMDFDSLPDMHLQDLYAEETLPGGSVPGGRFDATLEEVLHLVQSGGSSRVHAGLAIENDSLLAQAMDTARGGHFESIPDRYPEDGWYHYDDETCDYECMMVEYFYWGLTSLLGAQDYEGRCEEIANEWEACTTEQFTETDTVLHALLTDPQYKLPTVIPDGNYR